MRCLLKTIVIGVVMSLVLAQGALAQTTIRYSAWGNEQELAIERALIEAFERAHPDIRVELLTPTGNYEETLIVWSAGGVLPDVISLNRERYGQFRDILQPIDVERAAVDMSVYVSPALAEAFVFRGVRLGLPKRMNTNGARGL